MQLEKGDGMSNTLTSEREKLVPSEIEEIEHMWIKQELISLGHYHDPDDMICPLTGKIAPEAAIFTIAERPTHELGNDILCNACYGCITNEQARQNDRWPLGQIKKWRAASR